jgi:L-lysine 2,3-aminomutase
MHKARALANCYYWNKINIKDKTGDIFRNNVPDKWALEIIDKSELESLKKLESEASSNGTHVSNMTPDN